MTNEVQKPAGIKGMWDVSDLTDPPVQKPSPEQSQAAQQAGERLGFVSREAPRVEPPVERPKSEFTARVSVRVRPSDKQLLEDLGWRLRRPLGDIVSRALQLFVEEQEAQDAKPGGREG
ncbi:hypothetical protein [Sphingomonas sp. CARO-RG-8B-R24-01]|uniref:hypothetical protein n=1 Tax=Sphingomonas sp. CARO-RG-8B-R24-01 TaxID=2914831 RepID=UPI001F59CC38|nr:hypothetical protein [Sphingomonas sp. CARO-RG-8B-R24-01]